MRQRRFQETHIVLWEGNEQIGYNRTGALMEVSTERKEGVEGKTGNTPGMKRGAGRKREGKVKTSCRGSEDMRCVSGDVGC